MIIDKKMQKFTIFELQKNPKNFNFSREFRRLAQNDLLRIQNTISVNI